MSIKLNMQRFLEEPSLVDLPGKIRRRARREQLNATCPYCGADVLDELSLAANVSVTPSRAMIECPDCARETEFDLAWEPVLCGASPRRFMED